MSELYLVKLNLEALEALKDKAWEGKNLDVAIWVNNDVDHSDKHENWKAISIKYGQKSKGEKEVYVGNGRKYVKNDNPPF